MLPWQSLPYPSSEITGKIKMETTSSDYVCIDPENPETIVHHPTISDRNVPSISQIDISHTDFDYPEDLNCRFFNSTKYMNFGLLCPAHVISDV